MRLKITSRGKLIEEGLWVIGSIAVSNYQITGNNQVLVATNSGYFSEVKWATINQNGFVELNE